MGWPSLWTAIASTTLTRLLRRFICSTREVSSLTFGGDDYRDIYITTAGGNALEAGDSLAGALFRMSAQSPGVPEYLSRIEAAK